MEKTLLLLLYASLFALPSYSEDNSTQERNGSERTGMIIKTGQESLNENDNEE